MPSLLLGRPAGLSTSLYVFLLQTVKLVVAEPWRPVQGSTEPHLRVAWEMITRESHIPADTAADAALAKPASP